MKDAREAATSLISLIGECQTELPNTEDKEWIRILCWSLVEILVSRHLSVSLSSWVSRISCNSKAFNSFFTVIGLSNLMMMTQDDFKDGAFVSAIESIGKLVELFPSPEDVETCALALASPCLISLAPQYSDEIVAVMTKIFDFLALKKLISFSFLDLTALVLLEFLLQQRDVPSGLLNLLRSAYELKDVIEETPLLPPANLLPNLYRFNSHDGLELKTTSASTDVSEISLSFWIKLNLSSQNFVSSFSSLLDSTQAKMISSDSLKTVFGKAKLPGLTEPTQQQFVLLRGQIQPVVQALPAICVSGRKLQVILSLAEAKVTSLTSEKELEVERWNHVGICIKSNLVTLFLNGSPAGCKSTVAEVNLGSTRDIYLGRVMSAGFSAEGLSLTNPLNGSVCDVRLFEFQIEDSHFQNVCSQGPFTVLSKAMKFTSNVFILAHLVCTCSTRIDSNVAYAWSCFAWAELQNSHDIKVVVACVKIISQYLSRRPNHDEEIVFGSNQSYSHFEIVTFFLQLIVSGLRRRSTSDVHLTPELLDSKDFLALSLQSRIGLISLMNIPVWKNSFCEVMHLTCAQLQSFSLEHSELSVDQRVSKSLECLACLMVFQDLGGPVPGKHVQYSASPGNPSSQRSTGIQLFSDWNADQIKVFVPRSSKSQSNIYLVSVENVSNVLTDSCVLAEETDLVSALFGILRVVLNHVASLYEAKDTPLDEMSIVWMMICSQLMYWLCNGLHSSKFPIRQLLEEDVIEDLLQFTLLHLVDPHLSVEKRLIRRSRLLTTFLSNLHMFSKNLDSSPGWNNEEKSSILNISVPSKIRCMVCQAKDLSPSAFYAHFEKSHNEAPIKAVRLFNHLL
jgi:hypothetical protein